MKYIISSKPINVFSDGIKFTDVNGKLNYFFSAPEIFNIINNYDETVSYFNKIIRIANIEKDVKINFNLNNVKEISIDAIMYMIAISMKYGNKSRIFSSNYPSKGEVYKTLCDCGIKSFLRKSLLKDTKSDFFKITMGIISDQEKSKEMVKYCCNKLGLEDKSFKELHPMFVEMMSNTQNHAYNKYEDGDWFLCMENTKNIIKITFLDTGKGIPSTINKDFIHDLLSLAKLSSGHSALIYSTMNGDYKRSMTGNANRNKGLPQVYDCYLSKKGIINFSVISNLGACYFKKGAKKVTEDDKEIFFKGTLFYWELDKKILKNELEAIA